MQSAFETTDLATAEEVLSANYARMRLETCDGRVGLRLAQSSLGPVRLDRASFGMAFAVDSSPPGSVIIGDVCAGRTQYRSQGTERSYVAGEVFLAAQPEASFSASVENLDVALAVIDPVLLGQVADSAGGGPPRLTSHRALSPLAAGQWRAAYRFVVHEAGQPREELSPLVAGGLSRLLASAALATFPSTAVSGTASDRRDAHPATLRRCIAFIEESCDRDITPADIAHAAGVSIRAVQLAFRRHLGTTPTAYLRRVRLDHARDELRAGPSGEDVLPALTSRWGFANTSRFTHHYRAAFGETPDETRLVV